MSIERLHRAKILTRKQIGRYRNYHIDVKFLDSVPEHVDLTKKHNCDICSKNQARYFIERFSDSTCTGSIVDVSLEDPEGFYCSHCVDIFHKAYCAPNWSVDNSMANAFFQSYLFVYL